MPIPWERCKTDPTEATPTLIDGKEVRRLTGYSRSTMDRRRREGVFPIPVRDGTGPTAKHWYYQHEVNDYILSKERYDISENKRQRKGK